MHQGPGEGPADGMGASVTIAMTLDAAMIAANVARCHERGRSGWSLIGGILHESRIRKERDAVRHRQPDFRGTPLTHTAVREQEDPASPVAAARIQSLDGLRAVSITLVLLAHLGGTTGFPVPRPIMDFLELGATGVRVFFVISGFLITTLLLEEYDRSATISLRGFYFRRTMRIFPAYYAFLACAVVLRHVGMGEATDTALLASFTYTSNFLPDRGWLVGHTWSLGVEEQFYLLWPAVVAVAGPRRAMAIALAVVLSAPAIRMASWFAGGVHRELIPTSFQCVMDSIATGCVLCGVRRGLIRVPGFDRLASGRRAAMAAMLLTVLASLDRPRFGALVGMSASNLAVAVILDHALHTPGGTWIRMLNSRPLVWLGGLSYSLYLWQQPFLNRYGTTPFTAFPANLLCALAAAWLSHQLIERPGLRLRRRLGQRLGWRGG